MSYYDTRPVIVRTRYKDRTSHYVMTAKEAGEAIVKSLTTDGTLVGIEIIPLDGVSKEVGPR